MSYYKFRSTGHSSNSLQVSTPVRGYAVEPQRAPIYRDSFFTAQNLSRPVQPMLAQAQHGLETQAPKKETSIDLAALEARIQRLENERDCATKHTKTERKKMVQLQALFPVLEQENAHVKAESALLKKEVQDLREKMGIQQRLINSSDVRHRALEERLNNHTEHVGKQLEEVKNDKLNERILAKLEACFRLAYFTKVWGGQNG